jgi:hypothetical protein
VPGDGAKVLIPTGISVAYDGKSAASLFTVRVDGDLDFATDRDTFMEVDTFVVSGTGHVSIGTEANPVDANFSTVIQFANNGPIDVAWDPMLLSRGFISHGTVEIHGAEKTTFLKTATDPMAGDQTLTLEAPPSGWQVGDRIVLTGTHLTPYAQSGSGAPVNAATEDEERVITAINGNVITLDKPLQYDHDAPRADLHAYVANYSRNVQFLTENAAGVPTHERGHVMFMHSDNVNVQYAEFFELGRTDKSVRAVDAASLTTVTPDANVKGRYALHLHHTGLADQAHPAIVEGNAVWGSPGWGFVHHDSNAILSNNAAYDVFGAAFVAESGNETGRWDHNIAIRSLGVDILEKNAADVGAFDLGRTGAGFWFQGRLVDAVGNVAASIPSGDGFIYFHRQPTADTPTIDPLTHNLGDAFRYGGVNPNTPNIGIFKDNEALAVRDALTVVKNNPTQSHDLRSVIDSFLAWEVHTGAHLEYTGHYTFINFDAVATSLVDHRVANSKGIDLANNVIDVVVNGATIDGFDFGVRQSKVSTFNFSHEWDYIYIDVNIKNAGVNFTNVDGSDLFLTGSQLAAGRFSYIGDVADTHYTMTNQQYFLAGEKIDSIGRTGVDSNWDPHRISWLQLGDSLEQNGYWTTTDGRRVALIEEYVSDRATGEVHKVALFVEIDPTARLLASEWWLDSDPVHNGVLNQQSVAPVAATDLASVRRGEAVTINVLANDTDVDGDRIHVDGIFSQSGHVVDNHDGTVTYFADPNAPANDTFWYFAQDENGDITRGQVLVTITG